MSAISFISLPLLFSCPGVVEGDNTMRCKDGGYALLCFQGLFVMYYVRRGKKICLAGF